jgi:hypothetical protein
MKPKTKTVEFKHPYEKVPVRIVSDAAIATGGVGEGRLVPVLIVDGEQRPDITEMIRIHKELLTEIFPRCGRSCETGREKSRWFSSSSDRQNSI